MVKPDVIVSWPYHIDYPLFRHRLMSWRDHFDHIYIALTQNTMPEPHYAQFLIEKLPTVNFIKPPQFRPDWRDNAVVDVLENFSRSPYVLFLEQDFFIKDGNKFFFDTIQALRDYDIVYYNENGRIHPAFSIVKRSLIERTDKNFAVHPTIDHFGYFFNQVMPLGRSIEIRELRFVEKKDFYHLAGTTHNYYNFWHDAPLYKEQEWVAYNYLSQNLHEGYISQFAQSPLWMAELKKIEEKYGRGDYEGFIKDFFPKKVWKGEGEY